MSYDKSKSTIQSPREKIKNISDNELAYRLKDFYKLYNDAKKKYSFKISNNPDGSDAYIDAFFTNLKTIFLEDPDIQKKFFHLMMEALLKSEKPILITSQCDLIQKRIRKKIINQGYPDKIRKNLCHHYFRRINILKQKKFKTMQRYSHFCKETEKINYADNYVTDRMRVIDDEIMLIEQKYKRLKHDDSFSLSIINSDLKNINNMKSKIQNHEIADDFDASISSIAKDDIICYLRDLVYHRKCSRLVKKISYNIKWIHYTKRFEIYKELNEKINNIRMKNETAIKKCLDMNKNLLLTLLKDKNKYDQGWNYFVQELFHIQDENPLPYALTKLDYPPIIDACRIEVLNTLEELSKMLKLDFSDSINMQAYLYKIDNIFKIVFENQIELSNYFDGDNKNELFMVNSNIAELNRKKSINEDGYTADKIIMEQEKLKDFLQGIDLVREPRIYKIQVSDWLKELIFERDMNRFELNVAQILNNQKFKDPYLKNVLDLIEIHQFTNMKKFFLQKTDEQVKCGKRKILNLILNFKYFNKPKQEVINRFMAKLIDHKENEKIKDFVYHSEFTHIEQKLRNRSLVFRRGEEYIDDICQIYDEEMENQQNILKRIYQMQMLIIRSNKRKLLLILNYIRSIQRKLTLDLFQMQSNKFFRDKLDSFIANKGSKPEKPKDEEKKNEYKHVESRKGFLYLGKNLLNQKKLKEVDSKDDFDSLICRRDDVIYEINPSMDEDDFNDVDDIKILNDKGEFIIYDCVFGDMKKLDSEFLKIGSFYIDKFEKLSRSQDPSQQGNLHRILVFSRKFGLDSFLLVDRMKVTYDLYELEKRYQFAKKTQYSLPVNFIKARYIEEYYEIFEHLCDPLEQYKLINLIVKYILDAEMISIIQNDPIQIEKLNIMEQRPVLDFNAFYFKDSYENEIKILKRKTKSLKLLKSMQIKEESIENKMFYEAAIKFSEIQNSYPAFKEYTENLMKMMKKKEKEFKPDILSTQIQHKKKNEDFTIEKEDAFDEMRKTFTTKKPEKEDEGLKDFVYENNSYSKSCLGGPHSILALSTLSYVKYFPNAMNMCLLDFFSTLTNVSKLLPLIDQVCEDYFKAFKTTDIIQRSCAILTIYDFVLKDLHDFDLYSSIENIESSPLVDDVGTLDHIVEIINNAVNGDKIDQEFLYKLDINYLISRIYSKPILNFKFSKEEHATVGLPHQRHKEMFLYCNLIEFHRLKEEMIYNMYETKILERIYLNQRRFAKANDDITTMYFRYGLNFPTKSQHNVGLNIGEGSLIPIPMKVNEFDDMLKAHCNFMSLKSLSYLIIKDELECFRSALKYEIVNKEIFIHQITFNQLILDYPGKLDIEIDLLLCQNPYVVPNSSLDIDRVYAGNENIFNLKNKLNDVIAIQRQKIRDIVSIKVHGRAECEKLYSQYELININHELEEIKAKRCRVFRRVLLDMYLDDLIINFACEANKFSLIDVCKRIKDLTYVIPNSKLIFTYKNNPYHELDDIFYADQKKFTGNIHVEEQKKTLFDEKGLIENIFYIPTEPEILDMEVSNGILEGVNKISNFDTVSYYKEEHMVFSPHESSTLEEVEETTTKFEEEDEIVKKHFKKLIGYSESNIYDKLYINFEELEISKFLEFYNYLYEILNERLLLTFMELTDEEILIIYSLINLNQPFPDYNYDMKTEIGNNQSNQQEIINKDDQMIEEHEDFGRSVTFIISLRIFEFFHFIPKKAFREVLAEKNTYKHMHICMSNIREYFRSVRDRLKSEYKMMDITNLIKYFKLEIKYGLNRTCFIMKSLMPDIVTQNLKSSYISIIYQYLNIYTNTTNYNNNLGLRFNHIIHNSRYSYHPYELEKDMLTDFKNFENFFKYINKKADDEINNKLYSIMNMNVDKIRRLLCKIDNAKLKKVQNLQKTYIHHQIKYIKLYKCDIYGTSNIFQQYKILHLMSILRSLDYKDRLIISSSIKHKDANIRDYLFYKSKKRELSSLEYHQPIMTKIKFAYQLENLPYIIQYWQKQEGLPYDPQKYLNAVNELRETCLKDVDIIRSKIRQYQKNQLVLEIPKKYTALFSQVDKSVSNKITAQDLSMFSETEVQLCHRVSEHMCFSNMMEKFYIRDALVIMVEEYSAMMQFFHKYEEDLYKVSTKKKIEANQYFCSTLVTQPRIKTNTINSINELHNRVYMVQSFINKLRNRSTKVNLINSGVGYVISASDLDECLAKLAKHVFDKSNIDNINRDETHNLFYSHLNSQLEMKSHYIQFLEAKIQYINENIEKMSDTMLFHKGNTLIFEMDAIIRDLYQVKDIIGKLEDRLRDKIFKEVQDKIDNLKLQIMIKDQKFKDFRLEVASFVKTELKIGSNNIYKVMNKRIATALDIPVSEAGIQSNLENFERENAQEIYLTTVLVNKLRIFYKIREGLLKEKYEEKIRDLEQKMQNYNEVYENLVETNKREFLLKKELLLVQRSLAYQEKMNQELKGKLQQLNYDRLRLERFKDSRGRKVEKLEEEIKELKIVQNVDVLKLLEDYKKKESEIEQLKKSLVNFDSLKLELDKINDNKLKLKKKELAREIRTKQKVLEKLNEIQQEMSPDKDFVYSLIMPDDNKLEDELTQLRKRYDELFLSHQELNLENTKLREELLAMNQKAIEPTKSLMQQSFNLGSYVQIINNNKLPFVRAKSRLGKRDQIPMKLLPEIPKKHIIDLSSESFTSANDIRPRTRQGRASSSLYGNIDIRASRSNKTPFQ